MTNKSKKHFTYGNKTKTTNALCHCQQSTNPDISAIDLGISPWTNGKCKEGAIKKKNYTQNPLKAKAQAAHTPPTRPKDKTKQNQTQKKGGAQKLPKKMTFLPMQELASDDKPVHYKSTTTKPLIQFPTFWTPLFLFHQLICIIRQVHVPCKSLTSYYTISSHFFFFPIGQPIGGGR